MASADAASATSCFRRVVPEPPPHASCPLAPLPPSLLPLSSPNALPPLCFPPRTEPPSPPLATTAATGPPSLPQLAHQLRHSILTLPAISRDRRSPEAPPRRSSPLRTRRSPSTNSSAPGRPRPRRASHRDHCELLRRLPLFPGLSTLPSHGSTSGRSSAPPWPQLARSPCSARYSPAIGVLRSASPRRCLAQTPRL